MCNQPPPKCSCHPTPSHNRADELFPTPIEVIEEARNDQRVDSYFSFDVDAFIDEIRNGVPGMDGGMYDDGHFHFGRESVSQGQTLSGRYYTSLGKYMRGTLVKGNRQEKFVEDHNKPGVFIYMTVHNERAGTDDWAGIKVFCSGEGRGFSKVDMIEAHCCFYDATSRQSLYRWSDHTLKRYGMWLHDPTTGGPLPNPTFEFPDGTRFITSEGEILLQFAPYGWVVDAICDFLHGLYVGSPSEPGRLLFPVVIAEHVALAWKCVKWDMR